MADIKNINLNGTVYNIVDESSRTVANAAKTAADTAANKADAAKTAAETAQTAAQDAATQAGDAVIIAQTANDTATSAETKAQAASTAASNAQTAAETAQSTADTAKTNAATAQSAAKAAKEAADELRVRQNILAGSKTGNPVSVDDAFAAPLCGLTIYGKSTQDGTPSPDAPVPIVSAGDGGTIAVTLSDGNGKTQTLTLPTPTGLPGIRVGSGGNYTDPQGQQWVCDEVDLERGVKVQRIGEAKIKSAIVSNDPKWYDANKSYSYEIKQFTLVFSGDLNYVAKDPCNRFIMKIFKDFYNCGIETGGLANHNYAVFNISKALGICTTIEEFKVWFNENVVLYKILTTPIETPLTPAEIAAYKALTAYAPNTVVQASDGAGIKMTYQRDINIVIRGLYNGKS